MFICTYIQYNISNILSAENYIILMLYNAVYMLSVKYGNIFHIF